MFYWHCVEAASSDGEIGDCKLILCTMLNVYLIFINFKIGIILIIVEYIKVSYTR